MSNNRKILIFEMISFKNFCQNSKICYFRLIILERQVQNNSGRFLCLINARSAQFLVLCVSQGVCHLRLVTNTTQLFFKNGFKKNHLFRSWKNTCHIIFIFAKMLVVEISYIFLYVWNCMKLYGRKFFNHGNSMIRSFGQPG